MNAYNLAQKHLSEYSDEYKNGIDPLIKSTCEFLTKQGFITLHSCSGHIKVTTYKDKRLKELFLPGFQQIVKYNRWQIVFVATKPISELRKALKYIEKEYGYKIKLRRFPHRELTKRWELELYFSFDFTDEALIELNENLEQGFKEALKKETE